MRRETAVGLGVLLMVLGGSLRADQVFLRGGGQVQGKVIPDPAAKKGERVLVILPSGKTPLSLRKEQILKVVARPSPLDEYATRRQALGQSPTARDEYDLGVWCDEHELPDLASNHVNAALAIDPDFADAHRRLGHVEEEGRWLTPDDQRAAAGLVRHKGKWASLDEKDRDEEETQVAASYSSWVRRITLLVQKVRSGDPGQRRDAEDQLLQLQDPEAVGPLVKVLGRGDVDVRVLLAQALGEIPGQAAARTLVDFLLNEDEDQVRGVILDRLRRREEPIIASRLVRALRSSEVPVVNRAAWALGNLEVYAAVPRLLDVLVMSEERMVMVPPSGAYPGGRFPPLMAYNGSAAAYMTGPVVAPGAVAYGAFVVPNTVALDPFANGAPISLGDGMGGGYNSFRAAAEQTPQPAIVTFTSQNVEVRNALIQLTGQDFEYNVPEWRAWVTRSFNPRPDPLRRAPQP